MEGNKPMENVAEKPKRKRTQGNAAKRESKKKQQEGHQQKLGNVMPNTVQYHPDVNRLGLDGQGTSPRLHNVPPKKSLSPSFIASHAAAFEGGHQPTEPTHTVQHLPTSHDKQNISVPQSSSEKIQFPPDLRFMGQIMSRGPPQLGPHSNIYRQFTPHGLDQGGLLRQQLLQGARPGLEPPRSSPSYQRPGMDQLRSSPSYPSPPPNRTVHNIPGASPPSSERGRPKVENIMEGERTSPYHVSAIRMTPSPAPKHHRMSPAPPPQPQLSPHYRHDVSPALLSGERMGGKPERAQLSLEEAIRLMQGHQGASIPPQILAQLAQQSIRLEPEDAIKSFMSSYESPYSYPPMQPFPRAIYRPDLQPKEPVHKQDRSSKQFISTMLANQAKSRQMVPGSVLQQHARPLSVDTQADHASIQQNIMSSQYSRVSPRQVSPSSGELRQVTHSGGFPRQVIPTGGMASTQVASTHIYHPGMAAIPSSVLPTSIPQTAQTSTTLLQPQVTTSSEAIRRIPSPKPQHRHKDFAQAQIKAANQNIHFPDNTGPIRQPVVELVKIPLTKSTDGKFPTFSASQMTSMSHVMSIPQMAHPTMTNSAINQLPFSQSQGVTMATEANKMSQGIMNPFTFPSRPSVMISQPKSQPRYEVISPVVQPVVEHKRKLSDIEMPQLDLVQPLKKESSPAKVEMCKMKSPFNMRLQNLANLPTNSMYRSTYRAHSVAVHRAKAGLITSTAKTLDLLRQNLQKFINKEIDTIVKQYLDTFFKPGIENIKCNNGENSVTDDHVQAVCRQILEEAKKMYTTEQRCTTPVRDENTPVPFSNRKRNASDTDSEKSASLPRKKKGRPPIYTSGRSTPSKPAKANEPVKREGPKWDSGRLVSTTRYIMGARANKALGLGATRGRIYIKHPDVFKYCGDQDDKQWLYENHKMPATGGKAYMMLLEDVKDLAVDDEYRNNANVMMDEITGFSIPDWMTEKVKGQMEALRTDKVKQRSRSTTPNEAQLGIKQEAVDAYKDLPFSNFATSKDSPQQEKDELQTSPSGDTEMEFLTGADNEVHNMNNLSPFNLTGGFDDTVSPSASDLDTLEDEAPLSAPFELSK